MWVQIAQHICFTVTLPLQRFQVSSPDSLTLTLKDQDIEGMKARDNQFHYLLVKVSICSFHQFNKHSSRNT